MNKKLLSPMVTIFLPIFVWILPYGVKIINKKVYEESMLGEFGIIENLTILFLFSAVITGTLCFFKSQKNFNESKNILLKNFHWWILLITLGCLYFGGEEASWGQHLMKWSTPELWQNLNDQGETNLHNTSSLFDQLPRFVLTLGALIGGIITPLLIKIARIKLSENSIWYWLLPGIACLPAAIFAVFIENLNDLAKIIGEDFLSINYPLSIVVGEFKECFLGLFLLIYLLSIYKKLN